MKIKKVGEVPESELNKESSEIKSDFDDSQFSIPKGASPVNNNYLIVGSVIFLILIGFVLYLFVFKENTEEKSISSRNTIEMDELKRKELELKERELKLKEKQLNQSSVTSSTENSVGQNNFGIQASDRIKEWINSIGSTDRTTAYYMMTPQKRGDYSRFNSTKGYGGVTSTTLYSCNTEWTSGCSAEVVAYYESIDPYNKSGRYKQRFYLNNCSGNWVISDIKNISIENY